LHAELKESNEQGAEIEETESTVSEVEADIGGTILCSYGIFFSPFFMPLICRHISWKLL
jgi:hypothetical protein